MNTLLLFKSMHVHVRTLFLAQFLKNVLFIKIEFSEIILYPGNEKCISANFVPPSILGDLDNFVSLAGVVHLRGARCTYNKDSHATCALPAASAYIESCNEHV